MLNRILMTLKCSAALIDLVISIVLYLFLSSSPVDRNHTRQVCCRLFSSLFSSGVITAFNQLLLPGEFTLYVYYIWFAEFHGRMIFPIICLSFLATILYPETNLFPYFCRYLLQYSSHSTFLLSLETVIFLYLCTICGCSWKTLKSLIFEDYWEPLP